MADKTQAVKRMLREVLAPLLAADGAELYLVELNKREVRLHLAGKLNGCPGTPAATDRVVAPALRAVAPKLKLTVTSGWSLPAGAELVKPE